MTEQEKMQNYLCALCNVSYITRAMPVGESGRIVLVIEPELKRRLYSALALDHETLKEWFIARAREYVQAQQQPKLFTAEIPTRDTTA